VQNALAALAAAAPGFGESAESAPHAHLMPLIVDAVRARASVGEISDALGKAWGFYRPGS
jgi:methylmalonyl-CoA mutase N-terminal domain/subunit